MAAQMDKIMRISRAYNIPLIEDAAEALGSTYKGKLLGTFGDLAILSFNGNKIITTSGGGALISKDADVIQQSRFLATQARDSAPHYEHSQIGYNYRMSNICAGIGRGQMEVLPLRVYQRRKNFTYYKQLLSGYSDITFQNEPDENYYSNHWLTAFTVDSSSSIKVDKVRIALEKENIESRPLWKPMHLQPVFSGAPFYGDGTSEELFKRGLCLPSGSNLTESDIEYVVKHIKRTISAPQVVERFF